MQYGGGRSYVWIGLGYLGMRLWDETASPATCLVRKLVAVLESIEKLPVYTYDAPGSR